ncbi:MAG: hypothetical protein MUP97_17735 [Acidimicrobiia bacterium]|nr:hypothetical protein [Acidimicrobiia bacterium]
MDDDRRAAERSEDAALVARARGEDPDAFGRLYDRWFGRVHDLAFRITRNAALDRKRRDARATRVDVEGLALPSATL